MKPKPDYRKIADLEVALDLVKLEPPESKDPKAYKIYGSYRVYGDGRVEVSSYDHVLGQQ